MSKLTSFLKKNRFNLISWAVTFVLVAGMILGTFWWKEANAAGLPLAPIATAGPDRKSPKVQLPALQGSKGFDSIGRGIQLKTDIPADKPRYGVEEYRVARGDSIFAIAKTYKLKPETVLWANYDVLQDTPDSLRPGQVLKIPPTDGIYYQWKENDTLDSVAKEFKTTTDEIVNYPGNDIDLTDPKIKSGSWVMVPGGSRET